MASLIYNSAIDDAARALIDYDGDSFAVMLVDATYVPSKDSDLVRDDVSGEVSGTGYSSPGEAVTVSVTKDTVNDRVDISLGGASWPAATITARGAVYYQVTGNVLTDRLIAYIDFGGNVASTNGTFSLSASILRYQN